MSGKDTIEMLVEGGKATPNATTAPKFSSYKLNPGEIFKQINDKTKDYAGMQVPVKVIIDKQTKAYEIEIGIPPTSSLIKKELGIKLAKIEVENKTTEGAPPPEQDKTKVKTSVGSLKMESIAKIAKIKKDSLLSKDFRSALKQVVGTANSLNGVMINDKRPKEVIKEIDEGKWDSLEKE